LKIIPGPSGGCKMLFSLKREDPGVYKVKVNNTVRYRIKRTSADKAWVQDWEVEDLYNKKKYADFVSLSECKEFINDEIFS
tara:strand:+ start:314 stop:556 length:243 start_codon:yes stop_codon:yes gene_type:complete